MTGRERIPLWSTVAVILLPIWLCTSIGRTIHVDANGTGDYSTVQFAIDDSNDGDTIIASEGIYHENLNFTGKNIIVRSRDPTDSTVVEATIIDEDDGGPPATVTFLGTEGPDCLLSGFNINGYINGFDLYAETMRLTHTHATISHCRFFDNRGNCSTSIQWCDGVISNCLFADNNRWHCGFDQSLDGCHGLVVNCTFANNRGAIYVWPDHKTTIRNCIFYKNQIGPLESTAQFHVSYSIFYGTDHSPDSPFFGTGNIFIDPCFVNLRTLPQWPTNPDYHLKSQAGRWDPETQSWVKDDVTSPCIDAGDPASPIGNEPFPNGGRINMGAYGGTAEASKSYFGDSVCETIIAGDINGDCKVNFADFKIMALHWLNDYIP